MERSYLHDCGNVTHFDDDELPRLPSEFGHSVLLRCDGCDQAIALPKTGLPEGRRKGRGKLYY